MLAYAYEVLWADLDANQHLRNTRYLDYAAQTRFRFLEAHGFPPAAFAAARLGPVVFEDQVRYRRELRHLQRFSVDIALAGQNDSGSRFTLRNVFRDEEGEVCAEVSSHGAWFSLAERRIVVPPQGLAAAMEAMPRAEEFVTLSRA